MSATSDELETGFETFDQDLRAYVSRRSVRDAAARMRMSERRALLVRVQIGLERSCDPGSLLWEMGWRKFEPQDDGVRLACIHSDGHLMDFVATGLEHGKLVDVTSNKAFALSYGIDEIRWLPLIDMT